MKKILTIGLILTLNFICANCVYSMPAHPHHHHMPAPHTHPMHHNNYKYHFGISFNNLAPGMYYPPYALYDYSIYRNGFYQSYYADFCRPNLIFNLGL